MDFDYIGIQLDLIDPAGKIYNLWVPGSSTPSGSYSYHDQGIDMISVEAYDGKWHILCHDGAAFRSDGNVLSGYVPLLDSTLYMLSYKGLDYVLYVEFRTRVNSTFHNYKLLGHDRISIGRIDGNDIKFEDNRITSVHAFLSKQEDKWFVEDNDSVNGVYVNGYKVKNAVLLPGDVIYILGLKIVIGIDFISLNLRGRPVTINRKRLAPYRLESSFNGQAMGTDSEELFNRHPRKRKALKFESIPVDSPPMSANDQRMPMMLTMGRTAFLSMSSMMAGHFLSVINSMLFPILTQRYTDKQKHEYEERRNIVYRNYLQKKHDQIKKEQKNEETTLRWNYPELSEVLKFSTKKERLWERQKTDDDFLTIRIGVGDTDLLSTIEYSAQEYMLEEDELEKERRQLCESRIRIHDVPIQTSLIEDYACGISGEKKLRIALVRNMILQLVMLHSYDEVKLVLLCSEEDMQYFSFVRYFPHIWDDKKEIRFLANNAGDSIRISEYLKKEIYPDDKQDNIPELNKYLKTHPYYCIFALDKKCFDGMEILKQILQEDKSVGVSIISAFDDLPKECSKIFSLDPINPGSVLYIKQLDHDTERFLLDSYDSQLAAKAARTLANTSLRVMAKTHVLPKSYTFLEMFQAGKIEHLNIENRWASNNPVQSLTTPIGIGADGSLFMLDLHQKYHGPHGLVAGTTGSGKSEFLMTYILSMAVNYHPDEVAFVLIDYKGGGLAGAFDDPVHGIHLPHLIGTITNLDGNAIQRSLISIESELLRRQRIFSDVKNISGEGTMDIYTYQRLYRNKVVSEPLPHLFIIADEFAELKQKEPEFMEKLISAARIGRSLGIHLILATQKPSGVVNDQIRSNTKFRVCLKVQDANDSNDMLKRPDAAEIKETGRFYLQIGFNEFFAMGQSAWSGADYMPQDAIVKKQDDSIQVLDSLGQNVIEVKKKTEAKSAEGTQLVAIVKYISDIAKKNNIRVRPLWKPPLPTVLSLSDIDKWSTRKAAGTLFARVGVADDPHNMEHHEVSVDLMNCGNLMVIGEQGSGKTTFLKTILYDVTMRYSPDQVVYYIVDCSNHSLRLFRDTPHCGAWVNETMEDEIDRVFELLFDEVGIRKKLFEEADVSTYEEYVARKPLPMILFVIDNMAGLAATANGGKYQYDMGDIVKKCSGLGIQFLFASSHMNDLYTKTKQEIKTRFALEMKDKYAYQELLNYKCIMMPALTPGRGMMAMDETLLEFQTAVVCEEGRMLDEDALRQSIGDICEKYKGGSTARRLPMLDFNEEYIDFCRCFRPGRIPLGYSLKEIKPVALPFKQMSKLSLYFGNENGKEPVWNNLISAANFNDMDVYIIKKEMGSVFGYIEESDRIHIIDCDSEKLKDFILDLSSLQTERIEVLRNYCRANGLKASDSNVYMYTYEYMISEVRPVLVIMESLLDFNKQIPSDAITPMSKIWANGRRLCIYYAAGFYPDEPSVNTYTMGGTYTDDSMDIWMGGSFDRQPLSLPMEYRNVSGASDYNKGIMRYRNEIYPLFMPCGELRIKELPEDDRSIF